MSEEFLTSTLQTLSNIIGTSGYEGAVRQAIRPLVAESVDEMRVDALGNLITYKRGTGERPLRVLVTAHMDEVGLMVVGHTGEGSLKVAPSGGLNARLLPGLTVSVGQDKILGVIGLQAIHRAKGMQTVPEITKLVVDIGAKKKDEAAKAAPLGTPVGFITQARQIEGTLTGKAFDDRVGCAMLATLLRADPYPFDVYGVFTVQEEVGLRGAQVAAYAVDPDVGIALECTVADDLPKEEPDVSPTTALGKGPAITVKDRSYTTPPCLLRHFVRAAEDITIPYQLKRPGVSGTEAGSIHIARGGVPAITVAVPSRYIHSPRALLRARDLTDTWRLVRAALLRLTVKTLSL